MGTRIRITNNSKQPQDIGGRWVQPGASDVFDADQVAPEWRAGAVVVESDDPRAGELEREGDRLYVRKADGSRNSLVEAGIGPGGVVRNSLGELVWRPGRNQLVKRWPRPWAVPHNRDGAAQWTSATPAGGGAITHDLDVSDPLTGLPMTRVTLPAGAGSEQRIDYIDLPIIGDISPDHVWLLPIRIPYGLSQLVRVRVQISGGTSFSTPDIRIIHLDSAQLQDGMQVQQFLNHEIHVTGTDHTTLGTTHRMAWTNQPGQDQFTPPRSLRLRILGISPGLVAPDDVWVGGLSIADPDWCTSAMMWAADDVPSSFHDLALPVFEERGIPVTLNVTSGYTTLRNGEYMNQEQVTAAAQRGHEIWGHTRRHDRMTEGTAGEKLRALREDVEFWRNRGIETAGKAMAWPFGAFDADAIALAKSLGYKAARATHGVAMCSAAPLCERYALPGLTVENITPNQVRAAINGMVKRGSAITTYMHNALPGGEGITAAAGGAFYIDHLKRYLDEQVLPAREAGRCVTLTMSEYFRACGVDMLSL